MRRRTKKLPPDSVTLVSAAELAEIIGVDFATINNWIRYDIISRAPIGGRQLRSRLFSLDEVYKAAFTSELVKLGLAPSSASEAVSELWAEWVRKEVSKDKTIYAVIFPTGNEWSVLLCWQRGSGGPFYKFARSITSKSEEIELPKQGFVVLPVSDIIDRVTEKLRKVF